MKFTQQYFDNLPYEKREALRETLSNSIAQNDIKTFNQLAEDGIFEVDLCLVPLAIAARYNRIDMAKTIIKNTKNLNPHTNNPDDQPVLVAARYGHLEMLDILIDARVDVNWKYEEDCPIISFICEDVYPNTSEDEQFQAIQKLLNAGAELGTQYGTNDAFCVPTIEFARRSSNKRIYPLIHDELINHPEKYGMHTLNQLTKDNDYARIEDYINRALNNPDKDSDFYFKGYNFYNQTFSNLPEEYIKKLLDNNIEIDMTKLLLARETDPDYSESITKSYFEKLSETLNANNITNLIDNGADILQLLTKYKRNDLLEQFKEKAIEYLIDLDEKILDDSFVETLLKTNSEKKEKFQDYVFKHYSNITKKVFMSAARNNDLETVSTLIYKYHIGVNIVNDRHSTNMTALDNAAQNGHNEMVKLLLDAGAIVTQKTITKAVKNGHEDITQMLLKANPENINFAINVANRNNRFKLAKKIYNYKKYLSKKNFNSLIAAYQANNLKQCRDLIAADKNFFISQLIIAAQRNDLKKAEILINLGLNPYEQKDNSHGIPRTAMENAQQNGHTSMVNLLKNGFHKQMKSVIFSEPKKFQEIINNSNLLDIAIKANDTETIRRILTNRTTDVEDLELFSNMDYSGTRISSDIYAYTLVRAIENNQPDIINLAINEKTKTSKVKFNFYDGEYGHESSYNAYDYALRLAAKKGENQLCEKLIKNGASCLATNNHGINAVMMAAKYGHLETVKYLIEAEKIERQCIEQQNNEANTAQISASRHQR